MKIDEISVWEAFQAVAIHKSFSKAARALKLGVPQVSKRIVKLEDGLGVRLFQRSTRVVLLTEEGRDLLPRVSAILEDLHGIESNFVNLKELTGTIHIASVPFIANRLLIPVIQKFKKIHPQIQINIDLSERIVNFSDTNLDLAIRIDDNPEDSNLIYRKLVPNPLLICASPEYLKNNPQRILKPKDLSQHEILSLDIHESCRFNDGSILREFKRSKRMNCDDGWFLTQLALANFGVLIRSYWDVKEYLENGELIELLNNFPLENFGHVYAIIPHRRLLATRVRVFLDLILSEAKQWK